MTNAHMVPRDVIETRDAAMADDEYQNRCFYGEKVFYSPADRAYAPGHIYSEAGVREHRISQCCEWHFDQLFKEDDGDLSQD